MGTLEATEAKVAIDEEVALLEPGCAGAGAGAGTTAGVLALERSQLKGDLLTGGAGGCGAAGGVGVGGGSGAESFLGGSAGGTPLEVAVEAWELVEDLENRFVNDSTMDVGDVDTVDDDSVVAGTASFGGGSSSIRDTSSREEVDMRRWLNGDFGIPVSFTEPFMVVAGVIVIDCWLLRLRVGEFEVVGDCGVSVLEEPIEWRDD